MDLLVKAREYSDLENERDFDEFESLLQLAESEWELGFKNDYMQVWKERDFNNREEMMIKCEAVIPFMPKHIPFEALADIHIRKKWDEVLNNLTIVEENLSESTCVFYYNIKAPSYTVSREVIMSSKVKQDLLRPGTLALHHKTIEHPDYPEDPSRYVRVQQRINAFLFEDSVSEKHIGTKLTWIVA